MSAVITCPEWCETKHTPEDKFGISNDLHEKSFGLDSIGNVTGASVIVWVVIKDDGLIESSGVEFDVNTALHPEDLEEVAGWCTAAAAFMREIRGAKATV